MIRTATIGVKKRVMKIYTISIRPNANAFAGILIFDPDCWIELETITENIETYTVSSVYTLDALIDAAPGIVEWDEIANVPENFQ